MTNRTRQAPSGAPSRVSRSQILQAARLHFIHGKKQAEIAQEMGISAGYLARLLDRARTLGWVKVFVDADREVELATRIRERYPVLKRVEVVPSSPSREATAEAVATVMAAWFDETIDRDEQLATPSIKRVAIGGSWPMRLMVDRVEPRQNRLHVGPTSLTPSLGRQDRFTAPMVATLLGFRLGALPAANVPGPPGTDPGRLYTGSFDPGEPTSVEELRATLESFSARKGFQDIVDFWNELDVAFISVVRADVPYSDVRGRLTQLGLDPATVLRPGGALVANRVLDAVGTSIDLGAGVPTYEPCVPTFVLREMATGTERPRGVVLEAWGDYGRAVVPVLEAGLANVLVCDSVVAADLLGPG